MLFEKFMAYSGFEVHQFEVCVFVKRVRFGIYWTGYIYLKLLSFWFECTDSSVWGLSVLALCT